MVKYVYITITANPENHGDIPCVYYYTDYRLSEDMLCIWLEQPGVLYYQLLKKSETITGDRY